MPWLVTAICDGCGKIGPAWNSRTKVMRDMRALGWRKGGFPGKIYCPGCAAVAETEREKRNAGEKRKAARR
jgi:hypothetical protein